MTRNAGRPISSRIREVLEITEALGQSTTLDLRPRMTASISAVDMCKICTRAVGLGLLRADRSTLPITYKVAPDWRTALESCAVAEVDRRSQDSFASLLAAAVAMRPDVRTTWRALA
jgi:hypothetical protein